MKLTDTKCKNAKAKDKNYKISDGDGLVLMVKASGSKIWHFNYSYDLKRNTISFGRYPEISLSDARKMRHEARTALLNGINPSAERKKQRSKQIAQCENTFYRVALRWKAIKATKVKSKTMKTAWLRLNKHIFPTLGKMAITTITRQDMLKVLKKLEKQNKLETTRRILWLCTEIFDHAICEGIIESNPAVRLEKVLQPPKVQHRTCIDTKDIGILLKDIDAAKKTQFPQTAATIDLLFLTFVRTHELTTARWDEFDLDNKVWIIPAYKTKMGKEHQVPLSRQAIEILKNLKTEFKNSEWVLPSINGHQKHINNNIVLKYLERVGYKGKMTGHGIRSLAATILTEELNFNETAVDRQLSHQEKNQTKSAYFRAEYWDDRVKIMQNWADYLERWSHFTGQVGGVFKVESCFNNHAAIA